LVSDGVSLHAEALRAKRFESLTRGPTKTCPITRLAEEDGGEAK
jgi:hypothetical protein